MGSEWKSVPFRELYAIPSRNGLTKPKKIRGEGYKFINMGEIFSYGRMLNIECDRAPATDKELETSTLKAGDLLFARQSLVLSGAGKCSIFLGDDETTIFESHLIRVRPDAKQVLPEYLYYYFDSPIGRSEIWSITEQGAGQAGIRGSDLETVLVRLPSLAKQEKIVSILQAIDNKIALNRQINTTLESMAQALFKSWFVDFDPVIDNALAAGHEIPDALQKRAARREALRQQTNKTANETTVATDAASSEQALPETGLSDQRLPPEIQQLFPDRFVFTDEMGWVPEGWEVHRADEVSTISIGKTPPRKESQWFSDCEDSNLTWVSIKDMGACGVFIGESSEYLTKDAVAKHNVKMVPKGTVLLSFKLTVGRVAIAGRDLCTNEAIAHFANPKKGLNKEFLYCYLSTFDYGQLGSTSSIATAINSKIIKSMPVLVPSIGVLTSFKNLTENWFNQIDVRNSELAVLSNLRDSLLPKLLSGQITLPEAEQQLAEVL